MASGLSGKTALITGGTSGIGRATAIALAKAGVNVVLTGRRAPEGEKVASEVKGLGVKGVFVKGDVTDEAHIQAAVQAAVGIKGGLDFAFNNAGLELIGVPIAEATAEHFHQIFNINVLGVMLSMKHQIRAMSATGGGSIVNNASIAGSIGLATAGIYCASKHAVIGLTKCAALEAAPAKIRVNSISPAVIETDMFERFAGGQDDMKAMLKTLHPIGRFGQPREIADPVLFLFSEASSFITAFDLKVDGGFTAQ